MAKRKVGKVGKVGKVQRTAAAAAHKGNKDRRAYPVDARSRHEGVDVG